MRQDKNEKANERLSTEMQNLKTESGIPQSEKEIADISVHTEKSEENQKQESATDVLKNNIMFEEKDISIFRLVCHLSYKEEYILMIFALIGSIGSGVAMPLMSLIMGESIGDFSETSDSRTDHIQTEEERIQFHKAFRKTADRIAKKFLYIGIGVLVVFFLANFLWEYCGLRQMHHLKEKYFARILMQEQGWFDQNNAYEFATKVQAQIEQIELGIGEKFGQVLEMVCQFIAGLIIAFTTSWELTLIILTLSPLIVMCIAFLIISLRKAIILGRKAYEKAGGMAEEVLYNIKTVVSFSNFDFEKERFNRYVERVHELEKEKALKFGASVGGMFFFMNCCFGIAILYAKRLIIDKRWNSNTGREFQAGDVMTVNFSTMMAVMSIGIIAPNIKILQEGCQAASDYFTLVDRPPQIDESTSTFKPKREDVKGRIEFKNITFVYPSDVNKRKILDGLNLVFEPGQKVALVGESGCGKSTTVNLIERLYEPTEGEVLVDGVSVKDYDLKYLRSLIGYVQQEPVLFNKTIKENVIFGREELIQQDFGGEFDKMIKQSCQEAYAWDFIQKLPGKLEYVVGIKGSKLSGGQKQRVAIARAILCKPKILILDEATSALDNKSEKEVQRALDNISKSNVTTVIIAHRLSTIKNADLIYAIKDGKVLEKGTHKELLEKNGYYAGLVKSQIAQDELESREDGLKSKRKSSMNRMSRKDKTTSKSIQELEQEREYNELILEKEGKKQKLIAVDRMRLLALFKNHKMTLFVGAFAAFVVGGLHPAIGFIQSKAINALSNGDEDVVRDDGTFYAGMVFIVAFGLGLFLFLKIWNFHTIGSILATEMRKMVFDKYLKLDMGFYDIDENAPGALLSKLSIDTTQLTCLVLIVFGDVVQTIGVILVGLVLSFCYDYRLTLMALCFIPFIVAAQIVVNMAKQGGRESYRKINIEAGGVLSECVVNTKSIYSFNFQRSAVEMYLGILDKAKKDFLRDSLTKGILIALGGFAMFASKACLMHYSSTYIINGSLSYEDMNIVICTTILISRGTSDGLRGVGWYKKARLAFHSLFTTLDFPEKIDVSEEGNKNKLPATNVQGKIEFKNVTFAYPTKPDTNILKNISFTIEPGQAAALVGYSGCGKSTIIQLIERYYDVQPGNGEILIDGVNIKDYNLLDLRRKIGLVSQEPVLFKRSVYENIKYGKLTAKKEEVFNAAKRAAIEKFFNKKEMGTKEDPVSGGEKQRLAIARAFLKDPRILLLDEATSALDKESEIEVQKSLYELQKCRTSISVAHRLSTIVDSDVIFVLENGKIVEQGKHEELIKIGGKYSTLYKYSNMN